MKTNLVFLILILTTLNITAQYKISGNVTDNSGRIIEFAQVYLHGTEYAEEINEFGNYLIKDIELGNYLLKVSLLGYKDYEQTIFIDKNYILDIVLTQKTFELKEIHIDAFRANEKMPFAYKNISKQDLQKENTGEDVPFLLKHTPSVVTTSDAGAGIGYTGIRIRGTDPTRINVTINGIPLNDPESHQVYWVDLPDLAGSIESIQIQRGIGSSTNGAGAFGASVNVQTEKVSPDPHLSLEGGYGSFNTKKISVKAGTGLMNEKYSIDIRYSLISSDGYVDRATSGLNSFYFSTTRLFKNSSLKFNALIGSEKTYQAWYGLPVQYLKIDSLRTYNLAGTDYFKKDSPYHNQIDDYTQNHFQLFYDKKINDNLLLNLATHYTRGSGFYEQYKVDEDLMNYNMNISDISHSDLIRQKWLSNHFYGLVYSLNYNYDDSELILGGAANRYEGDHFGLVDSLINYSNYDRNHVYYKNTGTKNDFNIFAKYIHTFSDRLNIYGDIQYRHISYKINGKDDDQRSLDYTNNYNFLNPKFGLKFNISDKLSTYMSFSVANKEPTRVDYISNINNTIPKHERLYDIEAGARFNTKILFAQANIYNMSYKDQLVLTGRLDDVGNSIKENVDNSYRRGIELEFGAKINNFLTFDGNTTFSKNKITNYTEYISNWDSPYTPIKIKHENTDISFSPSLIAGAGLSIDLLNIFTTNESSHLNFDIFHKYVSKQFLDNTMNDNAELKAYNYTNLGLRYSLKKGIFKNLEISLKLNNALNKKYVTNGWIGRIKSEGYNPISDPYVVNDGEGIYQYMGLYPQALRNFMFRVKFDF